MPPSAPFHQWVQGIFSLARKSVSVCFFSSTLMLTKAKRLILEPLDHLALVGDHRFARPAPGCPDVEHDDLAFECRECRIVAIESLHLQLGRRRAGG